jgi:hypothetical protein
MKGHQLLTFTDFTMLLAIDPSPEPPLQSNSNSVSTLHPTQSTTCVKNNAADRKNATVKLLKRRL